MPEERGKQPDILAKTGHDTRSLSDLKNRSEKIAEREQNLIIFSAIVFPIAEKISGLWAAQVFLQPIPFKSDRLLEPVCLKESSFLLSFASPGALAYTYHLVD